MNFGETGKRTCSHACGAVQSPARNCPAHEVLETVIAKSFAARKSAALILLAAGAMSGLALPPLDLWWVLFATIPVLLWRLETAKEQGWRTAFMSGLSFGFGYFCVAFHWIGYAFFVNDADLWMMPFAVGGLALFMAGYWAVAVTLAATVSAQLVPRWLTSLVFIAAAEWLRGRLFTGFPWGVPGLAADGMGGVVQLASLVGMNGLTLLVLVWAALPVVLWQRRQSGLRNLLLPALLLAALPASHLWGLWRLTQMPTVFEDGVVVRLVQPNIAQNDKWRADNSVAIFDKLVALSGEGANATAVTHIIWPESAVPFLLNENKVALQQISKLLTPGKTLLTGAIRRQVPASPCPSCPEQYFTSILMIDDTGAVTGNYDKWRLVPGGEYLPFEDVLSQLGFRKVVTLPESFTAGVGARNLTVPGLGKAAMMICYEVIFPHALVAAERPSVLVNVTNDGWFGRSTGPYQHLAQGRFRSIEQGLPLLRAANTGISAVIDPAGRIVVKSSLEETTFLDSMVPRSADPPTYVQWGDAALIVLMIVSILMLRSTTWRSVHTVARG